MKKEPTIGDSQWVIGLDFAFEPRETTAVEIAPAGIHILPNGNGFREVILISGEIVDILPCQPPPSFIVATYLNCPSASVQLGLLL